MKAAIVVASTILSMVFQPPASATPLEVGQSPVQVPEWASMGRLQALDTVLSIAQHNRLVMFGELHGTQEAPSFVGDFVARLRAKELVVVGLEIPSDEQRKVNDFLHSDGSAAARAALIAGAFWGAPADQQDGRRSKSMALLLDTLRVLARGRNLQVACLDDGSENDGPADRDRLMADNVEKVLARKNVDKVVTLTGNAHSRLHLDDPAKAHSMADYLSARDPIVVNVIASKGTIWVCGDDGCGSKSFDRHNEAEENTGRIRDERSPNGKRVSLIVSTPSLTASPPAVEGR